MSDLHRAVEDEIDAFRPDRTPPFAGLLARRRARDRRRTATGAAALSAVAVIGIVFVPSALSGGEDRLPSVANPGPTQEAGDPELAARLCADVAQVYNGEVAAAYATTVQAVRDYMTDPYGSRTGMTGGPKSGMSGAYAYPSGWAEKAPDDPAAACYIDGSFPAPAVPGAVNPERLDHGRRDRYRLHGHRRPQGKPAARTAGGRRSTKGTVRQPVPRPRARHRRRVRRLHRGIPREDKSGSRTAGKRTRCHCADRWY